MTDAKMTGAALFVRCLEEGGIDTVYALPGEETTDLMDALAGSDIDIVLCRHEQAAAFMASVHGRLTGRPAACLATLGPGATNLITGVADAQLDYAPLLAITGQGARARIGQGHDSHQIIDLEQLFAPVTKLSRSLRMAEEIPGAVAEALHVATTPRPGAVHLSLPEDLAAERTDARPVPATPAVQPAPSADAMAELARHLTTASRPVVLAGAGVLRAGAANGLRALLDETGLPLATSFMSAGILPPEHPQNLGAFGLPTDDHVDDAIAAADMILTIGLDPVEYPLEKLTRHGKIPALSIAEVSLPRDAGWHLQAEVVGDVAVALQQLETTLSAQRWDLPVAAVTARDALHADRAAAAQKPGSPPSAPSLVLAIEDALPEDALLISGVGTHKLALARNFLPKRAGQMIIGNGLAGMGLALPGAIAAARLNPDRPVLAVCGDGDVMINVQDMETASRLGIDLCVVVWVDGGYGLIEDKQEAATGTRPDLGFNGIDWAQLAGAFGWRHIACDTADGFHEDLKSTFSAGAGGRTLITVPVRYDGSLA